MFTKPLFQGQLVRLTTDEPQVFAKALSRWGRDSEYIRLLDDKARLSSAKQFQEWTEADVETNPKEYIFQIHTLENDHLIGFIGLTDISYLHADAWAVIGIGEREHWNKGYGTDAMRVLLCYAFTELNLHRITLGLFEYNPRALRAYIKAGFREEGRGRKTLNRAGQRWDDIFMGILRSEWISQQAASISKELDD